ncbi:MAG TPA: hypothetical protein VM099_09530 [Gemmatimonadaceae bacterium]|nr:hypothetical protein [Gemmatimonadaceae bacterium]
MRSHPYDLVFALPQFEDETFPAIRDDAETHGVDVNEMERFSLLATVGELMRSLLSEGSDRTAYEQFRAIVFHAWHYWDSGKRTEDVSEDSLRACLSIAEEAVNSTATIAGAAYTQLPRNLIFVRMEEGAPEAIDGFFVTGTNVLYVLGLVPNRPGFSVIEATMRDELVERDEGKPFENILPGGEKLLGVTTQAELNTLAAKLLTDVNP